MPPDAVSGPFLQPARAVADGDRGRKIAADTAYFVGVAGNE